jgi:NAD(P)H-nitrite reductase large subunit
VAEYKYLIVGGGMTADAACRGIRDHDADGSIGLVGAEQHPPYSRPPLSKGLWQGGGDEEKIWRGTQDLNVELHLGRRVVGLDVEGRTATDDAGDTYSFERVLLATGGRPRRLPETAAAADDVIYFRTLDDYRRVKGLADGRASFVVIGGGFIGSEIAAALVGAGCRVTMIFPEAGISARLFPAALADHVTDDYRARGVVVIADALVERVERIAERFVVTHSAGPTLEADAVVAGLGILPATEIAEAAGLPVDDGIVVDEFGRAGRSEIVFAAGDVARFPVRPLATSMRVEHEDHANTHGRAVGANMAGAGAAYDHVPFFYSDLFDLGYEAVGEIDPRLRMLTEWKEPNREGVIAYVDDEGRARGFLLWGIFGRVGDATALLGGQPLEADDLRGLF